MCRQRRRRGGKGSFRNKTPNSDRKCQKMHQGLPYTKRKLFQYPMLGNVGFLRDYRIGKTGDVERLEGEGKSRLCSSKTPRWGITGKYALYNYNFSSHFFQSLVIPVLRGVEQRGSCFSAPRANRATCHVLYWSLKCMTCMYVCIYVCILYHVILVLIHT